MRITRTLIRPLALAPVALAISACGDDPEPVARDTQEENAEATGEVLGGSISDEMIPLEQLRSQSPPAQRASDAPAPQSED
ncbi:MAG: hypothetical protein AAGL68_02565 [Pseudomonadota bacterium]